MTKQEVIDLIKDAGFGFLATTEGSQPRVRPVGPHVTEEGVVLLALLGHSRSIAQIKKNPLVELCFVDRRMAFCRLSGKGQVSNDTQKRETMWNNTPQLKQYVSGPQDPGFVLVEVTVDSVEAMTPSDRSPQKIDF